MKILFSLAALALGIYVLFIALLYFKQNSLVYFAPKLAGIDMTPLNGFAHQQVETSDGLKIQGYYLAPGKNQPIIVEFHGNASHPAWEVFKFKHLIEKGYGLFLCEYRGYGGNPGIADEENLYLDADAYLSWIEKNPEFKDHPVVIYGASLGSGVAVDTAVKHPGVAAVILEVPFNKLSLVGGFHYPYVIFSQYLMKNKFPSVDKIKNIKAPALFLLARKDKIVPIQFGQALADAANQPKVVHVFEDAEHTDIYDFGAAQIVDDFLKQVFHD